ncbi:hypothetical protein LEP1GSC150_4472, partial [Leptospira interrogans serovar Copenhageni str. LT2050]
RKIVICESSHIILQINLSFVVVPASKESICREFRFYLLKS